MTRNWLLKLSNLLLEGGLRLGYVHYLKIQSKMSPAPVPLTSLTLAHFFFFKSLFLFRHAITLNKQIWMDDLGQWSGPGLWFIVPWVHHCKQSHGLG